MIIVQELVSSWGKDLRSSGELRRAVPEALAVLWDASQSLGERTIVHHVVTYLGEDGFSPSGAKSLIQNGDLSMLFHIDGLVLRPHRDRTDVLAVKFKWSVGVGAPERADRHIANLEKGQWLRARYNGRTAINGTRHSEWRYIQRTVNIAFVEQIDASIFVASKPDHEFEDLADLR